MTIRPLHFGTDYPEICEWWRAHKWAYVPKSHLSGSGYVAEKDGKKIAAVWLYVTPSAMAWVEWLVTNPKSALRARPEALKGLLKHIQNEAKTNGIEMLYSSLKNKNLIKLYESCGFIAADTNMTNVIWRNQ